MIFFGFDRLFCKLMDWLLVVFWLFLFFIWLFFFFGVFDCFFCFLFFWVLWLVKWRMFGCFSNVVIRFFGFMVKWDFNMNFFGGMMVLILLCFFFSWRWLVLLGLDVKNMIFLDIIGKCFWLCCFFNLIGCFIK